MRHIFQIIAGSLLIVVSIPFGWTAFAVGRNVIANLNHPAIGRMTGYGLLGVEVHGWQMYGFPIVCAAAFCGLVYAGLWLIIRRRDD